MSLEQYVRDPQERHEDDQYEHEPLHGHALTVGELISRLALLDPDMPVALEGCDCQGNLGWVSVYKDDTWYTQMAWLRRTTSKAQQGWAVDPERFVGGSDWPPPDPQGTRGMMEYQLVQAQESAALQVAVNAALQDGWVLYGAVQTQVWTYDYGAGPITEWWYIQTMVRPLPGICDGGECEAIPQAAR